MDKKPLTHKQCVKSDGFLFYLLLSALFLAVVPITPWHLIKTIQNSDTVLPLLLFSPFLVIGYGLPIKALVTRTQLIARKYFIYIDTVSGKKVVNGEDSTTYYLTFANNKYKKRVNKRKYNETEIGTMYFLVQINGAKKAFAGFSEYEYYLDESVRPQLR